MKDLTYIKVKEGKLLASDLVKPEEPVNQREVSAEYASAMVDHEQAMESFNQSFIEVGNPEFLQERLWKYGEAVKDGLHPVSGLQFEVREQYYHEYDDEWYDSGGLQFSKTRKVAILSIKSQSKCCKLNPNGCEDCTEFDKLNTPRAVAILSLKQEQKEQEPDVGHDDFESASKKIYSKLLSPLKQEQPSEEKEYILCSAIWFNDGVDTYVHQPVNIKTGYVVCGMRHHNCFTTVAMLSGAGERFGREEEQGFLTNLNRFVDRKEGGEIAFKSGQTKELKKTLYSEDLY